MRHTSIGLLQITTQKEITKTTATNQLHFIPTLRNRKCGREQLPATRTPCRIRSFYLFRTFCTDEFSKQGGAQYATVPLTHHDTVHFRHRFHPLFRIPDTKTQDAPPVTTDRKKFFLVGDCTCSLSHHSQYFPSAVDSGREDVTWEHRTRLVTHQG